MSVRTILIAGALGSLLFSGVAEAQTLKLSHNLDRNHPAHKAMEFMAKRAGELSGGEVKIRVYPNAELGSQRESLELVQNGTLALAKSNAAELEAFEPIYGAFNQPYIFKDREHFYRVLLSDAGRKVLDASKDKGFIGLAYYDSGSRSFYGKKPFNTPDDLKGLKVRVQPSPSAIELIETLGAQPVSLAYGELYTALQQGLVDAAENNITAMTLGRHGEVAKFYSKDEHTRIPDVLVISTKVWEGLTDKQRDALRQAAVDSMLNMKDLWAQSEELEAKNTEAMGVTLVTPDMDSFVKKVQPIYDRLQKEAPDIYSLIEEFKKL
ncbi:MAG: TRAP transporter substrate-binding protein [Methylobacteriaceae bacterium]|jgi:tripartite ATP-independent transporter DctP family solute receptor|nr:TRAP transporter substrate-binding protein [Methylobacteriaceae bacterium]